MKITQSNIRSLSIGLLCFQGFGIRIFDGIIPGAILIWTALIFFINYKSIKQISPNYWIKFILIIIFFICFNLLKGVTPSFFILAAWLSAFFILSNYLTPKNSFIKDIYGLTRFCLYYSLLHIPIGLILNDLFITTSFNMNPKTFLYLFFFNKDEGLFGMNRIQGFCWEPSCWNLLLNLHLVLSLFYNRKKEILLTIIAIISIKATTGIVVMAVILLLYTILFTKKENLFKFIVVGSLLLPIIISFAYEELLSKLETGSGASRMGDIFIAISILNSSPILGADLANITENVAAMNARLDAWDVNGDFEGYMDQGLVNSFASLFVEWGLIIPIIIFVLMYMSPLFKEKKVRILFITTILFVIMGTPITQTGFFYLFSFSTLLINKNKYNGNINHHSHI